MFAPKKVLNGPKPEEGVIRDVSGTNFSGVAAEDFTVRTALTGSSPLGWRLVESNISSAGATVSKNRGPGGGEFWGFTW
jgi:hypothetical protein